MHAFVLCIHNYALACLCIFCSYRQKLAEEFLDSGGRYSFATIEADPVSSLLCLLPQAAIICCCSSFRRVSFHFLCLLSPSSPLTHSQHHTHHRTGGGLTASPCAPHTVTTSTTTPHNLPPSEFLHIALKSLPPSHPPILTVTTHPLNLTTTTIHTIPPSHPHNFTHTTHPQPPSYLPDACNEDTPHCTTPTSCGLYGCRDSRKDNYLAASNGSLEVITRGHHPW